MADFCSFHQQRENVVKGDRFRFIPDNVDKAPDEAGVYALYKENELIYYGRAQGNSVTIRTRLQAHLRGDDGSCTRNATHYRREVCSNPVSREKELLEEYKKSNSGKLPKCNERIG